MEARRSILFMEGKPWVKKSNPDFDVTMGSFDGAEISEIVGLYILSFLHQIPGFNGGLYRDNRLLVSALPKRQIEFYLLKTH